MKNKKNKELNQTTENQTTEIESEEVESKAEQDKSDAKDSKLESQNTYLQQRVSDLEKERDTWKNKYYEAYADMSNVRKNLEKDLSEAMKYRASGIVEKLLPIMSNFQMGLNVNTDDDKLKNFLIGFKMIYQQLENALFEEGVKFIDVKPGEDFDSSTMHAVSLVDGEEDNKVSCCFSRGCFLHERMIAPAMVEVTKRKEVEKEEKEAEETDKNNKETKQN